MFWKLRALPFLTILVSWQPNSAKLALLHKPCLLEYPVVRITFHHSYTQPQDTWTSLPASVSLHSRATCTDQGFLKDEVPQFWSCLFSFRRCCMHLQSYLMRAGGQILRKKAEPNHQRIADDWFCNFQSWHANQLGCICRSNSCKQRKGEVIKRTLAGVQRPHGTALNACHLPEHKPPVGSKMTYWRRTIDHQRHTPSNLPKFIPKNSVICFFKIDKACKEIFVTLQRFFEDLLQSEDLIRRAATRTKTALTIFQFWFHYFSAFPFKAFGIFLVNWGVVSLCSLYIAGDLLSWILE